jgi:methyl-accepting chemotaxis protein
MPAEEVCGVCVAFDQRKFTEKNAMPWVDRASWPRPTVVTYDYHEAKWEWYAGPKGTGKPYITEPYFDAGGSNIAMVSATRPVLDAGGRFIGVAGADLSLKDIRGRLASLQLPEVERVAGEEIYLVSRRGKVIAHPNEQLMLRERFDGESLKKLPGGAEVVVRASGTSRVASGAKERRLTWAIAPLTRWRVVLSVP